MTQISRRSLTKGAAWSIPAINLAAAAPALAASAGSIYFQCPTTVADLTASLSANVTFVAANGTYNSGSFLAPLHQDGSTFSISYSTGAVKPVNLYNADGTVYGQSSGAYLIPGCGATTCTPDVAGGYTLPTGNDVIAYDRYGMKHIGRVVAGTPVGCSPVTNGGIAGTWQIETDIQYDGTVCSPIAGPENFLSSISVPVSLLYLDGLKVVQAKNGGACCLYMNFTFDAAGNCVGSLSSTAASYTIAAPAAPAPVATKPHIDQITRTADGSHTGSFCTAKTAFTIEGGGFTGATAVTWNGISVPFTVINDRQISVTMPTSGGLAGISYPITVTTPAGTSNTNVGMTRQLTC